MNHISAALAPSGAAMLDQALQQAVEHHQKGRLPQAEQLYRSILLRQPSHAGANHNLGVLAAQIGQPAAGLPYLRAALTSAPLVGQYWFSYVDALLQSGQLEIAQAVPREAQARGLGGAPLEALHRRIQIATNPQQPTNDELANLAALFSQHRYIDMEQQARALTQRFPDCGNAWKALGTALLLQSQHTAAMLPLKNAAKLLDRDAEVHNNLGICQGTSGMLAEAEISFRRATALKPQYADAHNNLGNIFKRQERLREAESSYRSAVETRRDWAEAHNNLGVTLHEQHKYAEAEASFRNALSLDPALAVTHNNLGLVLSAQNKFLEAEYSYLRALGLQADYAEAHNNIGLCFECQGRMVEAEASYRRAQTLKPDYAEAHYNIGNCLFGQSNFVEAEKHFREALRLKPDFPVAFSNLLFCLTHNEQVPPEALFAEHRRFAEQFEAPLTPNWPVHTNNRDPERRLRVGFVSGDLRSHPIASFIEPVLAHLAQSAELTMHAYVSQTDDDISERLKRYFAGWHPILNLSDAQAAEKMRADGMDILVDLSGHTSHNRLLALARKPSPIQVSWMGYPGTTGLTSIDYYISDRFLLPTIPFDTQFTEKIIRLPAGAPFQPYEAAPPIGPLPARRNGYITFGSFNRASKIGPKAVEVWSRLLRALPESRMILGAMPKAGEYDFLVHGFADQGVTTDRLDFHERCDMPGYLSLHHQVDLCLDTFPYAGGTTTLHALWMGVPTLTVAGATPPGRPGASVLSHTGLEAFIAHDFDDLVAKGIHWSTQIAELEALRPKLRQKLSESALGHPEVVSTGIERAFRTMWRRWCAGLAPESFEIVMSPAAQSV
ncbi:MAG: tetratricopeptide repeat protein [Betaproteobacteria bacterium]|nr:tetratricopeptide repeat protein [Betaproteobacteria bacterium]